MNGVRLVIVVPCYNEEEVLKETTRQLSDVLARMEQEGKVAEGKILYVDDGSKDTTWKLIEQLSESHRCVAGLKLAHNVGHQQALWAVYGGNVKRTRSSRNIPRRCSTN